VFGKNMSKIRDIEIVSEDSGDKGRGGLILYFYL